jgi:ubiquinone/menaquinone biosynthesis C-methylase UbiE
MSAKRTYFDELAERWDSLPIPPGTEGKVAAFCAEACPAAASRVLDAGCGTGLLAPHLLSRRDAAASVVELDFALEMLREDRRKHPDARLLHICADARQLPFAEACFDAVLCFGVLPHLGAPEAALAELWRTVRPDGTLSVGHLMGSSELNALHQSLGEPVAGDTLPPAAALARILGELGAVAVRADDVPERYFVRADKGAK